MIDICEFAFVHFTGFTLNTITSVLLIASIGLAVDYSAHIAHGYMHAEDNDPTKSNHEIRKSKVDKGLYEIGTSVLNGGFTTFLCVLPLCTTKNYPFKVFFVIWIGIVIFGMIHGMILLPAMLSVIGPISAKKK